MELSYMIPLLSSISKLLFAKSKWNRKCKSWKFSLSEVHELSVPSQIYACACHTVEIWHAGVSIRRSYFIYTYHPRSPYIFESSKTFLFAPVKIYVNFFVILIYNSVSSVLPYAVLNLRYLSISCAFLGLGSRFSIFIAIVLMVCVCVSVFLEFLQFSESTMVNSFLVCLFFCLPSVYWNSSVDVNF
jgi:hypothetical protein